MEQRRLRLGDILDDYCPRERRVTNHAVVAMIEEDVKQTRCTTCDAEHAYKGARVPARRKKETPAALYKEVLAGMPEADEAPPSRRGGRCCAHVAPRCSRRVRRLYSSRRIPSSAAAVAEAKPAIETAAQRDRRRSDHRPRNCTTIPIPAAPTKPGCRRSGAPAADSRHAAARGRAERCPARARLHHPSHAGPRRWQRPRWFPRRPRSDAHAQRRRRQR